jgi:hypothetical protein
MRSIGRFAIEKSFYTCPTRRTSTLHQAKAGGRYNWTNQAKINKLNEAWDYFLQKDLYAVRPWGTQLYRAERDTWRHCFSTVPVCWLVWCYQHATHTHSLTPGFFFRGLMVRLSADGTSETIIGVDLRSSSVLVFRVSCWFQSKMWVKQRSALPVHGQGRHAVASAAKNLLSRPKRPRNFEHTRPFFPSWISTEPLDGKRIGKF